MLTKDIIEHLCRKHGAKHRDITPWVREWITRTGNTYVISNKPELFAIFHRYPNGKKWNFYDKRPTFEAAARFIDTMEARLA